MSLLLMLNINKEINTCQKVKKTLHLNNINMIFCFKNACFSLENAKSY